MEEARRRNLVSWEGLLSCLVAHARRGRPGLTAMRNLLEERAGEVRATDSGFECLVAVRLGEAGLPVPVIRHEETLDGRTYHIDLAYPDRRLAIELDGSHHREKPTWEADHPRQNALIMAGWTVLRYTWAFFTRHRGAMLREIRTALDMRLTEEPEPGSSSGSEWSPPSGFPPPDRSAGGRPGGT